MSSVGKLCFKCGHALTNEDIDKITDWGQNTKNDFRVIVLTHLGFQSSEDDPDQEAVVCWHCLKIAELQMSLYYAHNLEYPYLIYVSSEWFKAKKHYQTVYGPTNVESVRRLFTEGDKMQKLIEAVREVAPYILRVFEALQHEGTMNHSDIEIEDKAIKTLKDLLLEEVKISV